MEMDVPKEPVSSEEQASQIFPPSLMSMPEEVIQDCIFPFLNYKELLRLRRVSKPIKTLTEKVLQKNFPYVVREINETNFTFERYLQLNLPTTSIYLNNSSSAIFQDPNVPAFLRLHGAKITHLRVKLFYSCVSEQELHFYSMLPNLKVLEIQRIEVPPSEEALPIPANLRNLKTLKLNDIQGPCRQACWNYPWNLIQFCENLEYMKGSRISIHQIVAYIRNRHQTHPELPNLRFYDMEHFLSYENEDPLGGIQTPEQSRSFFGLAQLCFEQGVKLLNVCSELSQSYEPAWLRWFGVTLEELTTPIVSLRNFGQTSNCAELPFLEKLTIESTARSCFEGVFGDEDGEWAIPRWPKLKQVDLTIDGLVRQYGRFRGEEESTINLFNFLFDCERQSSGIEELAIRYEEKYRPWRGDKQLKQFPWVRKLTTTCPLLTKLTLENWKGGEGVEMVGFWEGFPLLEEIVLEACEQIGDEAFVGGQKAFLNLQNLNKLSLRGIHLMPKITDQAFQAVFQHLKVKQFYLTSGQPLKSVTVGGIESLLAGQFNSSVEKFPFDGWSLDEVSSEQFAQLKIRFRASHML